MPEPISRERSQQIRNVGFLTALLVVLLHSNNVQSYSLLRFDTTLSRAVALFESIVSEGLALCAVPFFLAIAAFLFFRNYTLTVQCIKQKYARRIHSLLIPYLFWNGFHYLVQMAVVSIPAIRARMDASTEPILSSQPGLQEFAQVLLFHKYNIPFWFIQALIVFVVLSPLVYVLLRHRVVAIGVLVVTAIATLAEVPLLIVTCDTWFYLFVGSFAAIHPQVLRRPLHAIEGSKLAWVFIVTWLLASSLLVYSNNVYTQNAAVLTGMAAIWFGYPHYKNLLPMSFWGRHTFLIYAIHPTLLGGIKMILAFVAGKSSMMALVSYLLAPAMTVGLIIWFCNHCELRLPRVYRFISGGR